MIVSNFLWLNFSVVEFLAGYPVPQKRFGHSLQEKGFQDLVEPITDAQLAKFVGSIHVHAVTISNRCWGKYFVLATPLHYMGREAEIHKLTT